jgi:hypothetical protein
MNAIAVSPAQVQIVKDALIQDPSNFGVGILHEPTGRIFLSPFDDLPNQAGHADLVQVAGVSIRECKGFVIVERAGSFQAVNNSHLNGLQGQPGSLQMPATLFAQIELALRHAGL